MKKLIYFTATIFLLGMIGNSSGIQAKNLPSSDEELTLLCATELHALSEAWVSSYEEHNPGITIHFLDLSIQGLDEKLKKDNALALISQSQLQGVNWENTWNVTVARQVVVPIINQENPLFEEFTKHGISAKQLAELLMNGTVPESVKGNYGAFHLVSAKQQMVQKAIIDFMNLNQELPGKRLDDGKAVIAAIQKDKMAIGFCLLSDLEQTESSQLPANITWLPIDKNGNGNLETYENVYTDLASFKRAVWVGKYPNSLIQKIYAIGNEHAVSQTSKAFISWVLSDGQEQLNQMGYSSLVAAEIPYKLGKIPSSSLVATMEEPAFAGLKIIVLILAIILTLGFIMDLVLFRRYRRAQKNILSVSGSQAFIDGQLELPAGLFFDKTHTWAFMEQSGKVRVGIDDFIPSVTGYLTGIVMKEPGMKVKKGEVLMTLIQQGKQLNIFAPVSGKVSAQNKQLHRDASLLNTSPYDQGWVYLIEPTNWPREIQFYLMADKFRLWLKTEYLRLKDFLAIFSQAPGKNQPLLAFQEGGEINKGVLSQMGPEVWEEFQQRFIHEI